MKKLYFTMINLQLFAANATVASGSTGAIVTDGSKTYPYANHAYANPNNSLTPEMKVFYEKQLITEAGPNLVHDQFAQKRSIPAHGGKTIEFRKFGSLPKAMAPLTEGVTPAGQSMSVTAIPATVEQYGDYIEQTDILETAAIDNTIVEANKMLADQAGRTLDTVVRNVLQANANYAYAPKVSGGSTTECESIAEMDSSCRMSVDVIKKMVTALKNQNAKRINGFYALIMHPSATLDIIKDDDFIDISKYAANEQLLNGELGKIAGVRVVESTEAKVYHPKITLGDAKFAKLTIKTNTGSSTTHSIVVKETPATVATITGGEKVTIGGVEFTITAVTYGASGSTLTVTEDAKDLTANTLILPKSTFASSDGSPVFSNLFIADNAYGTVELANGGIEVIVKQLGSGQDPLNQRSTQGWKATATAVILNRLYMINCFSCSDEFDLDEN